MKGRCTYAEIVEGGTNQSPFPVSDVPHSSELGTVFISALVAWHSWTVLGCVSMILVCCNLRWCWIWEGICFLNSQQLRGGKSHSGSADSPKVVLYTQKPTRRLQSRRRRWQLLGPTGLPRTTQERSIQRPSGYAYTSLKL